MRRSNISGLWLLVVTGIPLSALARPGTPTDVFVHASVSQKYGARASVKFRNTATETVSFWMEWTENGVARTNTMRQFRAEGLSLMCPGIEVAECLSNDNFEGKTKRSSDRGLLPRTYPLGFVLQPLAYDSDYCFRFKAVDESKVVSEQWSAWACGRTPSAPPKPFAPVRVQVTQIAANDGRGAAGAATPPRALLEWDHPGTGIAGYEVEFFDHDKGKWPDQLVYGPRDVLINDRLKEITIDLPQQANQRHPYRLRVCAVNVVGKSCTPAMPGKMFTPMTANQRPQNGAAVDAARDVRPEPVVALSAQAPATTRAAAAAQSPAASGSTVNRASASELTAATGPAARSTQMARAATPATRLATPATPLVPATGTSAARGVAVRANEILCRGGEHFAMAWYGTEPNGNRQHLLYFVASDATPGSGAVELPRGRCAILDGSFANGHAGSLIFSAPASGPGSAADIAEELKNPDVYWRFVVRKDPAANSFEATQHSRVAP